MAHGLTNSDIARHFDLPESTVLSITLQKSWMLQNKINNYPIYALTLRDPELLISFLAPIVLGKVVRLHKL